MSIIGTYNGVSILALPTTPAPRQIQLTMNNMVAAPVNPFTGSTLQVLAWQGGDFWTGQIALPKLYKGQINVWNAFLAECRGKLNVFSIGDSSYKGPTGSATGTPVVLGNQAAMGNTINTTGWSGFISVPIGFPTSPTNVLLPGDYIQIGYRLHRVLDPVNPDSSGNATISIWPSLREAVTDGESIITANPVGLFRMAENKQSMTVDETRLGATSFNIVEAR